MPEPRDRRVKPLDLDLAATFARRRRFSVLAISDTDPSPFGLRTPGNTNGRGRARRLENSTPWATVPRARGRAQSRSVLPSWYPRTPLRDITVLVHSPLDQLLADRSVSSVRGARLEHRDDSSVSVRIRRTPAGSKVPKIVLEFAEEEEGESELLTPQKKLLNSIEIVDEVLREKLQKLEQSPCGRKAERERRITNLMSMR